MTDAETTMPPPHPVACAGPASALCVLLPQFLLSSASLVADMADMAVAL